jgi:hypothetical protein
MGWLQKKDSTGQSKLQWAAKVLRAAKVYSTRRFRGEFEALPLEQEMHYELKIFDFILFYIRYLKT